MRSWPLLLVGLLAACSKPVPPVAPEIPRPLNATPPAPPPPKGPDMLPAQLIATVDDDSAASYFARRTEGSLLFYSAKGRWLTRALAPDGNPRAAQPLDVAALGADVSIASLKPVGDGYVAVWVELVAQNHLVKLLELDLNGKAKGEPTLVHQVTDDLTWIDLLPNARGALVLWEVPHDDKSDIFVVPFAAGKIEGSPIQVAHDVIGWEAEATERGAAIASVALDAASATPAPNGARPRPRKPARTPAEATANRGAKLGKVFLTEVDSKGKGGAPVLVSGEATAQIDVTLSEVGGKYIVAWTDERNIDASVYLAAIEAGGRVSTPAHRAMPPFGEQALVSLVAEPYAPGAPRSKRGLLAWEDQLRSTQEGRLIHLATVGADAQVGKERAVMLFSAGGQPDLEPDGDGFAALTLAQVRELPDGVVAHAQEGVKGDNPVWPAYVRFGADLSVTASEPLRSEVFASNDNVPYLVRNLSCRAGLCTAVGIGAVVPAKGPEVPLVPGPLALMTLPARASAWKPPGLREADEAPPRPTSVTALFDGDHLARIAATELPGANRSLVGWVTYVIDAGGGSGGKRKSKGEEAGQAATLTIRSLEGTTPGKAFAITKKASSEGGLSLAAAPAQEGKKPEAAVAWVQRERGETQVFVTRLGLDGESLGQRGVTTVQRKKGKAQSEASDAAITYAGGESGGGDGWITAWIDSRDGNGEVYAARLDRSLNKVVSDQRITNAPGEAVEVQVAVRGKDAFLVWSDARGNPDEGSGDIYLARLDASTLKKKGQEQRLFASATHSRTPQITQTASGFIVSWIEEGADPRGRTEQGSEAGLRIAYLDDKGNVVGAPQLVRGADAQAAVTSAALGCTAKGCRGILTTGYGDALTLGAFQLNPGAPAGAVKTIAALTGGTQDASPVFANGNAASLFFADDAVGGTGRVRWMQIAWP